MLLFQFIRLSTTGKFVPLISRILVIQKQPQWLPVAHDICLFGLKYQHSGIHNKAQTE